MVNIKVPGISKIIEKIDEVLKLLKVIESYVEILK